MKRQEKSRLESENGAERAGADSTLGLPPAAGGAEELAAVAEHDEADAEAEAEAEAETTLRLQDDLAKAAELRLLTAMGWPGGDGQDEDDELEDDEGIPAEEIQKWQSANPEDHDQRAALREKLRAKFESMTSSKLSQIST